MKYCKDCEYFKIEYMKVPEGMAKVPLCLNPECADPVFGEPMTADSVRRSTLFCGIEAKYYKLKEIKQEPTKNVIQLPTS